MDGGGLPTEAEWEYAARGGHLSKGYEYAGSNKVDSVAWYSLNSDKLHPVGTKSPNELGLFDMSGNVWEWCSDWYSPDYYAECKKQGIVENPEGPTDGLNCVLRGGSWSCNARGCRSAARFYNYSGDRNEDIGFRVVFVP
ncbi:SUMF1/EgtB/PvdO family nonheme iron enzyme [candidate division KSB1 bacterium]|nr:SUMF1/EgtB/PvdO family nonheme iron enzyme [candidate division KSB1 bacterium]